MSKAELFKIAVSDDLPAGLRERLERTRLPDEVPGRGWQYGTSLACHHFATLGGPAALAVDIRAFFRELR